MVFAYLRPITLSIFSASLFTFQAAAFLGQCATTQHTSGTALGLHPVLLELEFDRAISILKQGLKEHWKTRDEFRSAFEKTPDNDSTGRPAIEEKRYVDCLINASLRIHQIWDEGSPIEVEVNRALTKFAKLRSEATQATATRANFSGSENQPVDLHLPPCTSLRKVAVSAGVAAGRLKSRIDPVYPGDAHVFGTVVLRATIDPEGHVKALRVISGPPLLYQAALNAVRQWTYRPYILNNMAVEVETNINVVFAPPR